NQLTDTFSGGWRMRIELAKLLLQNNDILLLDEPTNHLDIESIIWLENFLKSFAGAVVLVSHDKMFLDNVTNRTIEISLGKIYDFNKPYSQYLVLREEMREMQLAAQKNQAKKIEETEKLIEKFRYKATKASMAQSLIKKLDKIERIEVDEDDNAVMNISFPVSVTPGKVVLEMEHVTKAYGEKVIFKDINLLIERGSKIAFVGQNGQGKSTLIKAVMNEFAYNGTIKIGHNVQLGYFAQNQADYLDGEKTLLDTMIDAATDANRSKVRDILGSFLFRGDDVEKKVKVLSGGERNRLALAMLLLKPINVLLMDEPTNHLDIKSKNVLKQALKNYEGTLLLVSHDRDFLQGMTDKVYEFKDQKIKEYLGDINYFLEERNAENMREFEQKKDVKTVQKVEVVKEKKTLSYDDQKKIKTLNNRLSKAESKITELEKKIAQFDIELAQNYETLMNDTKWFAVYENSKKDLEQTMVEWEQVQEEIENA
ncbi:MAG TPA: ABC-F family ATP-binding cassette domain-containing protein, partial [Flavobacterium sp.]|nr:ABC-F family ATP-binding cassette domain-containing protein [Flavobacterium sp.]